MVETPRLQAKKRTALWPKAMSQLIIDQNPLIFRWFQPINEPTVFQTVVVQFYAIVFVPPSKYLTRKLNISQLPIY
jgi:hypothetical protein